MSKHSEQFYTNKFWKIIHHLQFSRKYPLKLAQKLEKFNINKASQIH